MSFDTYNVFFSGQIMKNHDPETVKKQIGAIFKLEGEKLDRLFSGQPVAIKKNIDMDQAVKFRLLFRDAGALVDIQPISEPSPQKTDTGISKPEPATPPSDEGGLSLSPAKSHDLSDCAPQVTPQTIPDISGIALDKPGVTLDETPALKALEIDTHELSLDDSGDPLHISEPAKTLEINTSSLSLSPPREGSLEAYKTAVEPQQIPNIDHLQLIESVAETSGESVPKPAVKARFTLPDD
jgi:hypothetical protein